VRAMRVRPYVWMNGNGRERRRVESVGMGESDKGRRARPRGASLEEIRASSGDEVDERDTSIAEVDALRAHDAQGLDGRDRRVVPTNCAPVATSIALEWYALEDAFPLDAEVDVVGRPDPCRGLLDPAVPPTPALVVSRSPTAFTNCSTRPTVSAGLSACTQ
jgi:hypothetical protein